MRAIHLSLVGLLGLTACSSTPAGQSTAGTGGGSSSSSGSNASSSSGTGGASASSSSGGTSTSTGTGGAFTPGTPITATDSAWTWVPFDNAFCGDGSTVGLGVNLSTTSSRVLVYMEGGGACWSDLTCYTAKSASYFTTGYKETDFTAETTDTTYLAEAGGFFDRTAASNPFKDYSYVYVPYCTGDIHGGNNVATYTGGTGHHVGFANMTAFLERIVPTFPSADRVILAGSSAGGFGAAFNWWQTQQAFGAVRVDLIDDSGTPMPPSIEAEATGFGFAANGAGESTLRTQWGLAKTFPPGCTGCTTQLDALLPFYATAFPTHRATLLSYIQDSVLPTFYGITTAEFTTGLNDEIAADFTAKDTNFQYFTVNAANHVLMFDPTLTPGTTNTTTLQTFITQMVTDDASWTSQHP